MIFSSVNVPIKKSLITSSKCRVKMFTFQDLKKITNVLTPLNTKQICLSLLVNAGSFRYPFHLNNRQSLKCQIFTFYCSDVMYVVYNNCDRYIVQRKVFKHQTEKIWIKYIHYTRNEMTGNMHLMTTRDNVTQSSQPVYIQDTET